MAINHTQVDGTVLKYTSADFTPLVDTSVITNKVKHTETKVPPLPFGPELVHDLFTFRVNELTSKGITIETIIEKGIISDDYPRLEDDDNLENLIKVANLIPSQLTLINDTSKHMARNVYEKLKGGHSTESLVNIKEEVVEKTELTIDLIESDDKEKQPIVLSNSYETTYSWIEQITPVLLYSVFNEVFDTEPNESDKKILVKVFLPKDQTVGLSWGNLRDSLFMLRPTLTNTTANRFFINFNSLDLFDSNELSQTYLDDCSNKLDYICNQLLILKCRCDESYYWTELPQD